MQYSIINQPYHLCIHSLVLCYMLDISVLGTEEEDMRRPSVSVRNGCLKSGAHP